MPPQTMKYSVSLTNGRSSMTQSFRALHRAADRAVLECEGAADAFNRSALNETTKRGLMGVLVW